MFTVCVKDDMWWQRILIVCESPWGVIVCWFKGLRYLSSCAVREKDGAPGASWLLLNSFQMTPSGFSHARRSKSFICSISLSCKKRKFETKRDLCLDSCSKLFVSDHCQMGPHYCTVCSLAGGVRNLTAQPWIVMVKGSVIRVWLALKRHWIKQPFNWFFLSCSTPKSCN